MEITGDELPLQRMYAFERDRASWPLFTQPRNGSTLEWTWASAMEEVRRVAAWLREQDWPAGSRIVILSKNCAWWIMADFAIWMAGHVSVPFFPATRPASLSSLFCHSQPVACFLGQIDNPLPNDDEIFHRLTYIAFPNAAAAHIPEHSAQWADIVQSTAPLAGTPARDGQEVATIIYTSGTTGTPKGAMQSFLSLSLMGKSMEPVLGWQANGSDRILSYLPLAHIAERAIVEMNALFGPMHIFFTEGQQSFMADLARARATIFFSIPRLYIRFQQGVFEKIPEKRLNLLLALPIVGRLARRKILGNLGLGTVRLAASGGAAIPIPILEWYRKLGLHFVEGYGMTETGITHVPLPGKLRTGYVGNASPYAETRISGDGEVQIKGPMNMLGYYRNPELTGQSFTADGYFHTGDRGEIDTEGRLRIAGRLKEEFKTSKGKYVVPAQVEKLLSLCTLFEAVAVFGADMSAPFAMAVLVPNTRADCASEAARTVFEQTLQAELSSANAHLEQHEQLRFLVVCQEPWTIENALLTPTLKVRRTALEDRFKTRFAEWESTGRRVIWLDRL